MSSLAYPEETEERRVQLIKKIADLAYNDNLVDSGFWGFAWLADVDKLQDMLKSHQALPKAAQQTLYASTDWARVLRMWCTQDHTVQETGAESTKRKALAPLGQGDPSKSPRRSTITPEDVTMAIPFSSGALAPGSRAQSPSKIPTPVRAQLETRPSTPITPATPQEASIEPKRYSRSSAIAQQCRFRDHNMCVLTKTLDCTQVAHVYPFALGAKAGTKEHRFFWDHLAMFWSAERIERWEKAIFGDDRRTETLANLMCLGPMTHGLWGKCRFAIKPIELSDDKKKLTVQFFWLAEGKYGPRHLQTPPTQPTNTSASASRTPLPNIETDQYIQSGDLISFTTHDPVGFPLPSIDLLDMQWALHRVSALSGGADIHDEDLDRDDSLDLAPPVYDGDDTYIALLEKEAEEGGEDEQEEMDNNSQAAEGGLLADVPAVVSVPRTGENVPLAVDHGKRHQ